VFSFESKSVRQCVVCDNRNRPICDPDIGVIRLGLKITMTNIPKKINIGRERISPETQDQ
jgi:hypothetical protein